jgi:hypothetical protein
MMPFQFYTSQSLYKVNTGRIVKILVPDGTNSGTCAVVVVEEFPVSNVADARYDMPLLINVKKIALVKPEVCVRAGRFLILRT